MLSESVLNEAMAAVDRLLDYVKDCKEPVDRRVVEAAGHVSASVAGSIEDQRRAMDTIPVLANTFRMVYLCGFLNGQKSNEKARTNHEQL